jgi:ribosome maturation factor RimP
MLALVTRLLSRELDEHDPVPGRYTLEVSSPGLERNLRRVDHYQAAIGAKVAIRLTHAIDGVRRFQGTLVAADDDSIRVRADDDQLTETTARYRDIERARTVFEWGPTPKPGTAKRSPKSPTTTSPTTREAGEA